MSNEVKKKSFNKIVYEGYLKENTLERGKNNDGTKELIKGSITVAISKTEEYKFFYTANKYTSNGNENKVYQNLEKVLPANTVSVASLLSTDPDMTVDYAFTKASKIYGFGSFSEYIRKEENGNVVTFPSFRGQMSVSLKKEGSEFNPHARFQVSGKINGIYKEKKEDIETGAYIIDLMIPEYSFNPDKYPNKAINISFVARQEQPILAASAYYKVGDSIYFEGVLRNISQQETKQTGTRQLIGGITKPVYETTYTFVNEREISECDEPFKDGHECFVSNEDAVQMLAERERIINDTPVFEKKENTSFEKPQGTKIGANESNSTQKKFMI